MYISQILKQVFNNGKSDLANKLRTARTYHLGELKHMVDTVFLSMVIGASGSVEAFRAFETKSEEVIMPFKDVVFEFYYSKKNNFKKVILLHTDYVKSGHITISSFEYIDNGPTGKFEWMTSPLFYEVVIGTKHVNVKSYTGSIKSLMANKTYSNYAHLMVNLSYSSLLFLNCRNITMCKHKEMSVRIKTRKKKKKMPELMYNTIEIEETRKRSSIEDSRSEEEKTSKSIQRRHHMPARIVYYTKEKPLFGNPKNVGFFAFKDYWKGDSTNGTNINDYKLKKSVAI